MNKMLRGMMIGGVAGMAASLLLVNYAEPRLGKVMMRKGKNILRQYRRIMSKVDML